MFLSNASVRRPVAMGCLIIALVLLGFNAYRKLSLELMPRTDVPYITVVTTYPGANPEEIEVDVAKPIEDAVVTIDGLKHVSSSCMENVCQTLLEFELDVDVDIVATDVREKLDLVRADFPEDVEDPTIQKYDVNAKPIITLALTGEVPLGELYDYADNTLRDRMTVLAGVADVQLVGGAERQVRVTLDRAQLAARGLSSTDVAEVIRSEVGTIPSGRLREAGTEYSVKFDADYDRVADIGSLEVASTHGQRCYLRDLGHVEMATEELRQSAAVDGRPCIAVKVVKKAEANAVRVTQAVREAMAELSRQLPGGMELVWVADDGRFIQASNASAWLNVAEGILLTALILFLFLYNLRSLFVVALTMPLTIVVGLFFVQLAGLTLNVSTLLATGMSVGILVTNSIVVLEAIVSRLQESGDAKEAARLGAGEAAVAVVASAGTNMVVLFPLSMMGSMVGLFIRPFALTMLIMTAASLFISFTLTPILCSVMLKPSVKDSRSWLARMEQVWNRGFQRLVSGYRAVLTFTERRRWAAAMVLVLVAAGLVHSLTLVGRLGFSMISEPDWGQLAVKLEFPTRYGLARTQERLREAERRLQGLPEVRHMLSTIGKVQGMLGQSSEGVHLAEILVKFSERDERELTIDDLQEDIRSRLVGFPDALVSVLMPSPVGGSSAAVELEFAGPDLSTLDGLALRAQTAAEGIPGIRDVDTTVRTGKPELRVRPRRAVLADLGTPATGVGLTLRANLEGMEAGTFKQGDRTYDIVVELAEEQGRDQVEGFLFPGQPGHPLALTSLADVEEDRAPVQITRKDKQRISRLLANLDSGKPLGTAATEISAAIESRGSLPPGYGYAFAGMYEIMGEGQAALAEAGIIAIVLVVLMLAAILESFKQPWLILVTVPLAAIGVLWALALTDHSLEIFTLMGGVMLIGIVVNNAILIVDQFNVHIREGVPRHKAMVSAACERFRPVAMITLAAFLGMLPLALGRGIGSEMRNAVGIASAGGILVSGVLTLIVIPVLYDLFTRSGFRQKAPGSRGPVPPDNG